MPITKAAAVQEHKAESEAVFLAQLAQHVMRAAIDPCGAGTRDLLGQSKLGSSEFLFTKRAARYILAGLRRRSPFS